MPLSEKKLEAYKRTRVDQQLSIENTRRRAQGKPDIASLSELDKKRKSASFDRSIDIDDWQLQEAGHILVDFAQLAAKQKKSLVRQ